MTSVCACMYKKTAWNFSLCVPKICAHTIYGNSGENKKATSIFHIHSAHLLGHGFKSLQLFKCLL